MRDAKAWRRCPVVLCACLISGAVPWLQAAPASAAASAVAGNWLSDVNVYRAIGGVPPVTENMTYDLGDQSHAQYMVQNNVLTHSEDPSNQWYTATGNTAGLASNVMVAPAQSTTDGQAVDAWMESPFHAMGVVDPVLTQVGYGAFRVAKSGYQMGAALDVIHGRNPSQPTVPYPVMWPGQGSVVPLTQYSGDEYPDPLTGCAGYAVPSGLPIIVQFGARVTTRVTAHAFTINGQPAESCEVDAAGYVNPNASDQQDGRSLLYERGAVLIIPRRPLALGEAYGVSLTVNGQAYSWSFAAGSDPSGAVVPPPAKNQPVSRPAAPIHRPAPAAPRATPPAAAPSPAPVTALAEPAADPSPPLPDAASFQPFASVDTPGIPAPPKTPAGADWRLLPVAVLAAVALAGYEMRRRWRRRGVATEAD